MDNKIPRSPHSIQCTEILNPIPFPALNIEQMPGIKEDSVSYSDPEGTLNVPCTYEYEFVCWICARKIYTAIAECRASAIVMLSINLPDGGAFWLVAWRCLRWTQFVYRLQWFLNFTCCIYFYPYLSWFFCNVWNNSIVFWLAVIFCCE